MEEGGTEVATRVCSEGLKDDSVEVGCDGLEACPTGDDAGIGCLGIAN